MESQACLAQLYCETKNFDDMRAMIKKLQVNVAKASRDAIEQQLTQLSSLCKKQGLLKESKDLAELAQIAEFAALNGGQGNYAFREKYVKEASEALAAKK